MQIYISRNGQQLGPYTLEVVNAGLAAGSFSPDDLAWHEAATAWAPLSTVPGVTPGVRPPPPPPPPAPNAATVLPLASRGSRLGAVLLDGVLSVASIIPGGIVCAVSGGRGGVLALGILLIVAAVVGLAVVNLLLLSRAGQTLGKRIVGVRIVKFADDSNPGLVKVWLLRSFVPGLISAIPYLGWLFGIIDACFIFREDRRCIHDLIAETKVVVAGD
jgi:uncharacterized RDD family membrane protein YckC